MQLPRGPPQILPLDTRLTPLRLLKAPAAIPPRQGWTRSRLLDSYSIRIIAGLLLITIPLSILLGFVMANWSAQTSIDQSKARAEATAESAAVRIGDWVAERRAELRHVAGDQVGELSNPQLNAMLVASMGSHDSFEAIQVNDLQGAVVANTRPGVELSATPTGATFANSLSVDTFGPVHIGKVGLDWIMTSPILGPDEKPQGVVVGDLTLSVLGRLLNPYGLDTIAKDQEVHIVNAQHLLLYSSDWGVLEDESLMIAKGTLKVPAEGKIFDQAMSTGSGTAEITDYRNHQVLAGFEPIPSLGWVVIASIDTATALAPVYAQELKTSLLQGLSTALLIAFAIILAIFTTPAIVALSRAAARVEAGDLTARVKLKGGGEVRRL